MKLRFSKTTKILAIFFSILLLIGLIPGLWILHTTKSVFGLVLIVIPLCIIIVYLIIVTIFIIRLDKDKLSNINLNKRNWSTKHLIALSCFWCLVIISLLLLIPRTDDYKLKIISAILLILSYNGISFSIAGLLDFNYRSIRSLYITNQIDNESTT